MPALNIEYTEHELAAIRAAAAADGKSVKAYVHDLSVREQQRRTFVDHAVAFWNEHVEEFDAAFPEDAPPGEARRGVKILHVDIRWLLDVQELASPEDLSVRDYSALQAAVARHRVNTAQLGHTADPAWCAATLMHTIVLLRPLPVRNNLYACMATAAYMHAAEEGIDPPYGALVELARDVAAGTADVFAAAGRIRDWRI